MTFSGQSQDFHSFISEWDSRDKDRGRTIEEDYIEERIRMDRRPESRWPLSCL